MAFWGVEVKSSKPYSHRLDTTRGRLHISQATLGIGSSSQRSLLQCNVGNKSPVYLCSLLPDKTESCPLNLEFEEEDEVIFSVLGPRSVHLSGFYIDKGANVRGDGDGDETDSYGEDIGETESEHSTDFRTEDEYEDDFIDDNDIEMFSPSPRHNSGVVIEEIVDDVKPVNRNGCRRRIKRKYQISDSEDDDQKQIIFRGGSSVVESESNDMDALPNSSLLETKDESAEIQEKPETVSKEKEKAQGGDQVISAERENEHVQASRTYRGLGTTNDSTLPSSEVGQENVGKPKKKKKKDGTIEEKPRKVVGDSIIAVHKEEKSQMEGANTDNITHGEPVRDEANVKPSNDTGLGTTNDSILPAFEIGQENVEKPKKKKKKGLNEEKVRGVVGDCSVDVHKEDKFQTKEVKVDDITQEEPVRDVDEKPSNDKGFEKTYGSALLAPEVGQEKAEKPIRKKKKLGDTEEKTDRVLVGDDIVHNEDRSQIVEAKADSIAQEDPVRDEADEKPSNDKGFEKTYGSALLALEVGQEKAEKPKRKKKKLGATEEKTDRVLVGDDIVHNEDRSQIVEAKADSIAQEDPIRDEADEKPSNDKGFGKPNESFPFYETGQENAEKPKKKKKKGGKAQLEEAKADDMVNVHEEDKSLMEEAKAVDISQEVFPVRDEAEKKTPNDNGIEKPHDSSLPFSEILPETTEKPKKMKKKESTKEGKTRGVAKNDVLDVQKEDKLQLEEAKADFIIQKDPVGSKADKKPSTDKVAEIDADHVVEEDSSESRKKHRKKNKKKTPDMDGNVIMEEAKEGLLVEIEDKKSKRKTTRKRS